MTADVRFWDTIAAGYAARPVEDPAAFDRKIAVMQAAIAPTDTVLDVGCGTGSLALRLAPGARHVHGLDVSPEMMRIAREKAANVQNVTFHTGTLDDATFPEGSLDAVSACSILHLVDDRDDMLARIYRLLKPGGFFVTSTVCLGESWIPYAPILTVARWLGKAPAVTIFSKQALAESITRAGFVGLEAPDVGAKPEIAFFVARRPAG